MKAFLTGIAFLCLSACSQNALNDQITYSTPDTTSKIINGTAVEASDTIASHVVIVFDKKDGYLCSGTIIDKNIILTAAHCLSRSHKQFEVVFSRSIKDLDDRNEEVIRPASHVVVNEKYGRDGKSQSDEDRSDIGLVYFEGDLPTGYTPAEVMFKDEFLKKGTPVIMAGYGVTQVIWADIKYKRAEKFIDKIKNGEVFCDFEVLDAEGDPTCIELSMSGDGELRKTQTTIKYFSQSEFVLDEKTTGTCEGDSGGPVFIEKEGKLYLVGLTSRGDLLCDGEGVYTSIPSFIDWILTH